VFEFDDTTTFCVGVFGSGLKIRVELGAENVFDLGDFVFGFLNRCDEERAETGDDFFVGDWR
jgi:hypothetical protein